MAKSSYKEFKTQLYNGILSCPIIYINHYHYRLVDEVLMDTDIFKNDNKCIVEYDRGQGCCVHFNGKKKDKDLSSYTSVRSILRALIDPNEEKKDIFTKDSEPVFKDKKIFLFKGLTTELTGDDEVSLLQTFVSKYEAGEYRNDITIIIVSPNLVEDLPVSLKKYATILDIMPPSADEIRECIKKNVGIDAFNRSNFDIIEDLIRTLLGLQMYEVRQTLKTSLILTNGRICPLSIRIALEEKQRIVKKTGIIEVVEPDVSFNDIGGLDVLREDLKIKSIIYNNLGDAIKYKVPIPKGVLIVGMPGCGKSMIAKATANLFKVPLLRLDVSRLMGKYVGESEANLRLALSTAESAHPCVLWIDEIEKAFAGSSNSSGENDMLVMRMMGHFLTWMQERKSPIYIVATANGVMRPEFMRKGRFDEVYFVDFPNNKESAEILRKKINTNYPANEKNCLFDFSQIVNYEDVVNEMNGKFSGSEIECVLNTLVEKKFCDYLRQKESVKSRPNQSISKITVTKNDFVKIIEDMKESIMANQKGEGNNKTPIELIYEMQKIYKFKNASNSSK